MIRIELILVVLVSTFAWGAEPIELRLTRHHDSGGAETFDLKCLDTADTSYPCELRRQRAGKTDAVSLTVKQSGEIAARFFGKLPDDDFKKKKPYRGVATGSMRVVLDWYASWHGRSTTGNLTLADLNKTGETAQKRVRAITFLESNLQNPFLKSSP